MITAFERMRAATSWSVGDLAHEGTAAGSLPLYRDSAAGGYDIFKPL
ncbi:MAG: hypothetical protein ABI273_17445 [Lacunisphaera sp.]